MRRGSIAIASALLALALGSASGGCGVSTFACSSDAQCQSGAAVGVCEPSGYCSFSDDECPSGQRFGDAAPVGLANACVEPEAAMASTTAPGSSSGGDTQPDLSQGLEASTLDPADSSATVALDEDGTSTGPAVTTGPSPEETTTGPAEDCTMLVDEFEGMALDPRWAPSYARGGSVELQDGQLVLTVPPSVDWMTTSATTDLGELAGGWARVWISELPDDLPMTAALFVGTPNCELQIYVGEQTVQAFVWNQDMLAGALLASKELPGLPIALQLRVDEGGVGHFEHSADGVAWESIASGSFPECGGLLQPLTGTAASGGMLGQVGTRVFDRFEACLPAP